MYGIFLLSVVATASLVAGQQTGAPLPLAWQADLQIRTLEITRSRASVGVRIVVYTEHDDEARDVRLLILLPVGVGLQRLASGCSASTSPPMVPSLRATVTCELGSIADHSYHEVVITTTLPPDGARRRFGVFAYSGTPDPVPGNNYAERAIP